MDQFAAGAEALASADDAFARYDTEALVAHLSAAVHTFTTAGAPREAALACARLGDVLGNLLGNVVAGRVWFARARRLIDELPPCVEQGWVAVAAMGCDVDDPDELRAGARLALDRARTFGDVNLETKALADLGLGEVLAGELAHGMELLDEAMALACGPADDESTAAKSVCSFFTACYFAGDYGRAATWADQLRRHGLISLTPGPPIFLSNHCDAVAATALIELGHWGEAEVMLLRAVEAFETSTGMPSWHPAIALADLRIRQGRLADAELLLMGKEHAVQALLPAARLHLARHDHELAAAIAARGLRALGDERLRAAELLALQVEIALATGRTDVAATACDALEERTRDLAVPSLLAQAARARGRTLAAQGDPEAAVALLDESIGRLDVTSLPWLHAMLRLEMARCRDQASCADEARLDVAAALAALEGLDVELEPADRELVHRLTGDQAAASSADPSPDTRSLDGATATLCRDGGWWSVTWQATTVRLRDTKGLRYLAVLLAQPATERHVLDLVDRIEGVAPPGGPDRRALGDAGSLVDGAARTAYRHRIEELRARADDALEAGMLEEAESVQREIDDLVAELSRAFGLGGRDRRAGAAVERARLNVTRAIRSATAGLESSMPGLGISLDARVRTGIYCAFEPAADDPVVWVVESRAVRV